MWQGPGAGTCHLGELSTHRDRGPTSQRFSVASPSPFSHLRDHKGKRQPVQGREQGLGGWNLDSSPLPQSSTSETEGTEALGAHQPHVKGPLPAPLPRKGAGDAPPASPP